MANPVLHIKDSYFFDVPEKLWQYHYTNLSQVPAFLTKAHPDVKNVEVFNRALAGKVIYWQPFGTLKNLYEPASGFCISKYMLIELVVAVILSAVFIRLARKMRSGHAPRGTVWNMLEGILVYFRDDVGRPAIGAHDADRFMPLLWTMFFFVLACNLMGMVPWVGAPTASFGVTFAMAMVTFATVLLFGMLKFGIAGFWLNQVPKIELQGALAPLKIILLPMIFAIEVLGMAIRHAVLAVRLLANMVAGHLVLLGILGLIGLAAASSTGQFTLVAAIALLGSTLFSMLELFVAFLQAYVFTFLSALFIGAAIHHH